MPLQKGKEYTMKKVFKALLIILIIVVVAVGAGLGYLSWAEYRPETVEELCQWADVTYSCVTAADSEFCSAETFRPGALVVPVHTRGFTQCDLAFDRVFCDDESHVSDFGYYEQFREKLDEMSDVLEGKAAGRDNDSQRIIAYNIGISLHDIYYASKVYDLVGSCCTEAQLEKPTEKFWA